MLVHGCGVSQQPQLYDKIKKKYQLFPHPYMGNYKVEQGHNCFQENWIIALAKPVETFVIVSINDVQTVKY